jgi:voltage-gated potassium channel
MNAAIENTATKKLRNKLHEIIFEADTFPGKFFDVGLIFAILLSVFLVMLDSVSSIRSVYGVYLYGGEWFFTIVFTIEYALRLFSVRKPVLYASSFYGIVDLLAILPTYFSLLFPGGQYFLVIRILRLLRIFRVLKLFQYLSESALLLEALRASRRKIIVFLFTVLMLVILFGSIMFVIEGEANGFTSIPRSIYWSIVTLTTVGYGDISPKTSFGQTIASLIMIIGYAIIAVPTGIVTVEMSNVFRKKTNTQACPDCSSEGHDDDATHCKYCGTKL